MKKSVLMLIVGFVLAGVLWAADFWQPKEYTAWTQKDCEQMLTKSPWAPYRQGQSRNRRARRNALTLQNITIVPQT